MVSITVDYEFDWGGRVKNSRAIEETTLPLLELLDRCNARATFFVSAETVETTKPMLRAIADAGHEIASHGFHHDLKYDELDETKLIEEIRSSKGLLEDTLGIEVVGFRTPQFRKHPRTEEILASLGFTYDSSSVNTSLKGRYKERQHEFGLLPEIPVSTIYGRFPAGVKWINLLGGRFDPADIRVIYLHPFDLLSIFQTVSEYRTHIPLPVLAFYLARFGSTMGTLESIAHGSESLARIVSQGKQ